MEHEKAIIGGSQLLAFDRKLQELLPESTLKIPSIFMSLRLINLLLVNDRRIGRITLSDIYDVIDGRKVNNGEVTIGEKGVTKNGEKTPDYDIDKPTGEIENIKLKQASETAFRLAVTTLEGQQAKHFIRAINRDGDRRVRVVVINIPGVHEGRDPIINMETISETVERVAQNEHRDARHGLKAYINYFYEEALKIDPKNRRTKIGDAIIGKSFVGKLINRSREESFEISF